MCFWEYNPVRMNVSGWCVWECVCVLCACCPLCLTRIDLVRVWCIWMVLALSGMWTVFLLLPQSGTRPGRIRQWRCRDQSNKCDRRCAYWIKFDPDAFTVSEESKSMLFDKRGWGGKCLKDVSALCPDWNRPTSLYKRTCIFPNGLTWSPASSVFHSSFSP